MSSPLKSVVRRMRVRVRQDEIELEIDEELQYHIEMREQDNLEKGMTPEEARGAALEQFGDYDRVKQDCLEANRGAALSKSNLKMAAPLALWILGLILLLRPIGGMENQVAHLVSNIFAVIVIAASFISIPACFRRPELEGTGPVPGSSAESFRDNSPQFHTEDGSSPLERAMRDSQ